MLHFCAEDRLALFIDGPNLHSAARSLGFDIDYKNLLETFRGSGRLVRAYFYTALAEDQQYSPIRPLIDWLNYKGHSMVTKQAREYTDATGIRRFKGNMSIELAVDMMEMTPHIDHAVLFSGDGDFRQLLKSVQRRGVRVTVISTFRERSPMVADELRRQADSFVELQDLAKDIARIDRRVDMDSEMPSFAKNPVARVPTPANPQPNFDEDDNLFEDA